MNSSDRPNRPGVGPLPPSPDSAFEAIRPEHSVTRKAPIVRELVDIPTATLPSITASSSNVMAPAPESITASDVELASKRYVAALNTREKAQARVAAANSELTSAIAEESDATDNCKALQQELLAYLK